jgi:hypothetical protein
MALKYSDIFHSKVLKNISKSGFLVCKYRYHTYDNAAGFDGMIRPEQEFAFVILTATM